MSRRDFYLGVFAGFIVGFIWGLAIGTAPAKAEGFPHCRFPGTSDVRSYDVLAGQPFAQIDIEHPEGRAVPSWALRNHPDYITPPNPAPEPCVVTPDLCVMTGPFIYLQFCQIQSIGDWLAQWIAEGVGSLRVYHVLYGAPSQTILNAEGFEKNSKWREGHSAMPLIYAWSIALDVSVFYSETLSIESFDALHLEAVREICSKSRELKDRLAQLYWNIAVPIWFELGAYETVPIPDIPYTTWDGANWDSDILLAEDRRCALILEGQ